MTIKHNILLHLRDYGVSNMSTITSMVNSNYRNVYRVVKVMCSDKLVLKSEQDDNRTKIIKLAPKGIELCNTLFPIKEDKPMSRLKRHLIVEPVSDRLLKARSNREIHQKEDRRNKRIEQHNKKIRATKQHIHIIDYWNNKVGLKSMTLPTHLSGNYATGLTIGSERAIRSIKKLLTGTCKIENIKIDRMTMAEIKSTIDQFHVMATDQTVLPQNKSFLRSLPFDKFLYDNSKFARTPSYFLKIKESGVKKANVLYINSNPELLELMITHYPGVETITKSKDNDNYSNFVVGSNHLKAQMDKYPGGIPGYGTEEEIWVEKLYKAIDHKNLKLTPSLMRQQWLYADCLIQYVDYVGHGYFMEKAYQSTDEYQEQERQKNREEREQRRKEEEEEAKRTPRVLADDDPFKKRLKGHLGLF